MSKQSSGNHVDSTERQRAKSKKEKPWSVWQRWPGSKFGLQKWWRSGRYATKEVADEVVRDHSRKRVSWISGKVEFCVLRDGEKPKE